MRWAGRRLAAVRASFVRGTHLKVIQDSTAEGWDAGEMPGMSKAKRRLISQWGSPFWRKLFSVAAMKFPAVAV